MNIIFTSYEAVPFFKTGGLGDVAGSLPLCLSKHGVKTFLTLPKYSFIKLPGPVNKMTDISLSFDNKQDKVGIYTMDHKKGVILTLIDHPLLKDPMNYGDKVYNFTLFSFAVVEMAKYLNLNKIPVSLIHTNDWFGAFVSYFTKQQNMPVSTLFTIHNLSHKGLVKSNNSVFDGVKKEGYKSSMEVGIVYSDHVNTVSPTYAKEIVYTKIGGNYKKLLYKNRFKVTGILNGIDLEFWNPRTDQFLYTQLRSDFSKWKNENKSFLRKKFKVVSNSQVALVSFIGRLDPNQKGIDLLIKALETTLKENLYQCVILGTGDKLWARKIGALVSRYPGKVVFIDKFDEALSHQVYAASDIILIPSKFEPCGLVQMIAMRYGTLPLVRKTGGLADTVKHNINGFVFENYSATELSRTLRLALKMFKDNPEKIKKMQETAMKEDFSWDKSAKEYKKLYSRLISHR